MLIKINRQDCLEKYPKFPLREYNYEKKDYKCFYPDVFASYILTLTAKSNKGHIKLLGVELANLTKNLGYDYLIFLGDEKTPWLYRNSDYKPAKEGLHFLSDNKIGKKFNGALQFGTTHLAVFIKHLAWLTRCNTVLPYIHFLDEGQNIIGHICQYGNLHIDTVNEKVDTLLKGTIDKSKFEYLEDRNCIYKYSKRSSIRERQIIV